MTLLLRFVRLSSSRNFYQRSEWNIFRDQANFNNKYYSYGSAAGKAEMKKNVEIIIKASPLLVELKTRTKGRITKWRKQQPTKKDWKDGSQASLSEAVLDHIWLMWCMAEDGLSFLSINESNDCTLLDVSVAAPLSDTARSLGLWWNSS